MSTPDFLKQPSLYFALIGVIVAFAPSFGIMLTSQQIGALMVLVAACFKTAPPTVNYLALRAYEKKVKVMEKEKEK